MRISWIAARCYAVLTERGPWVESCRALAGRAGAPGARRLLDVGAGPGIVALEMEAAFPDALVVGLDASRRMLAEARRSERRRERERAKGGVGKWENGRKPLPPFSPSGREAGEGFSLSGRKGGRVAWVCGDAARLPFRAGVFDGAAGHSVLYLTPGPEGVLREVMRVLRRGGRAGFVEPRRGVQGGVWRAGRRGLRFLVSMLGWRWVSRFHRRYDEGEIEALLKACGYAEAQGEVAMEGFGVRVTGRKPSPIL